MATVLENLQARRAAIAQALADLIPGEGMDKPEHTGEAHVAYVAKIKAWTDELEALDRVIRQLAEPAEVVTYGVPV